MIPPAPGPWGSVKLVEAVADLTFQTEAVCEGVTEAKMLAPIVLMGHRELGRRCARSTNSDSPSHDQPTSPRPYQPSVALATPAAPAIIAASATVLVMRDFIFTPLKGSPALATQSSRGARFATRCGDCPAQRFRQAFKPPSAVVNVSFGAGKKGSPSDTRLPGNFSGGALILCRSLRRSNNTWELCTKKWGRAPPDAAPSPHRPCACPQGP